MRQFNRKHDTLLWYAKGRTWTFNGDDVRIPHKQLNTNKKGAAIGAPLTREERDKYLAKGKIPETWWPDFTPVGRIASERTGYPTQKPLALYERVIKASSNPGDFVLDPFAGCATTIIAAERLGRKWVGMDIWDGAHDIVTQRMEDNRQLLRDIPEIIYSEEAPIRTDENEVAAPSFRLKTNRPVEDWEKISHRGMTKILVDAQGTSDGVICAGCGRTLEKEFMELDHITPKSDRGENHIMNRILLCRPCNGRKRDNLTLRGLMNENKRVGWMRDEGWATVARDRAADRAEWVRDNFGTLECEVLVRG